jgi:hypothetical protein
MEYPNSRFTKPWRRALLYLFLGLFFLITPPLLGYTLGYRFDTTTKTIKAVGALSVDALPKTLNVALNGFIEARTVPARINGLPPATYLLSLSTPGYYAWEKSITLHEKQTVYVKNVNLLKKESPELITTSTTNSLTLAPDGHALAYLVNSSTGTQLTLIPLKNKAFLTSQTTTTLALPNIISPHLTWSADSSYILLSENNQPQHNLWVIQANESPELTKIPLTPNTTTQNSNTFIDHVSWNSTGNLLYFSVSGIIYFYNPTTKIVAAWGQELSTNWFPHASELWFIVPAKTGTGLDITTKGGSIFGSLATKELSGENFSAAREQLRNWQEGTSWKILDTGKNSIILKNTNQNKLAIIRKEGVSIVSATDLLRSTQKNSWVLSKPYEIWSYTEGQDPLLLYRGSTELKNVGILNNYDTILLGDQENLSAFYSYYEVRTNLISSSRIEESLVAPEAQAIFFIGIYQGTSGLWKLNY